MNIVRKIKVLLVDDYDMVRLGLTALLKKFPDIEVVGGTGDIRMLFALCKAYHPDVILMGMQTPYMNGVTATRLIRGKFSEIQIVILSDTVDETLTYDVLKAGAISYLIKTGTINEVATAIRDAYVGKSTLAPEAVAALISVSQHHLKLGSDLTIREREILSFMVSGLKNGEIAHQLVISQSTVKNHVSNIFSKLDVGSRTKVVALAVQHKLYVNV